MSLSILISLIDGACKNGEMKRNDFLFLQKKAIDFKIDPELVRKLIVGKKIKVLDTIVDAKTTDDLLAEFNKPIREIFKKIFNEKDFDYIIKYYREKYFANVDPVITDYFLQSLLNKGKHDDAKKELLRLQEVNEKGASTITFTAALVYRACKEYKVSASLLTQLASQGNKVAQAEFEALVEDRLKHADFSNLDSLRACSTFKKMAEKALDYLFEEENYKSYVKLYESDLKDNLPYAKKYIHSLFLINGLEQKAYEQGLSYSPPLTGIDSIAMLMGEISEYVEKYQTAYDFYLVALKEGEKDSQEKIDLLLKKLAENKQWPLIANFKKSANYNAIIENVFNGYYDNTNGKTLLLVFNLINEDAYTNTIIRRHAWALFTEKQSNAVAYYLKYNARFSEDTYWLWIGGKIYEGIADYENSFNLYSAAHKLDPTYCPDEYQRVYFILNPIEHFKDLYTKGKHKDCVDLFETQIEGTNVIELIEIYISCLWFYGKYGNEEKALELAIEFSGSHNQGSYLYSTVVMIAVKLRKLELAEEYIEKKAALGLDVKADLLSLDKERRKIINEQIQKEKDEAKKAKEASKLADQKEKDEAKKAKEAAKFAVQKEKDEAKKAKETAKLAEQKEKDEDKKVKEAEKTARQEEKYEAEKQQRIDNENEKNKTRTFQIEYKIKLTKSKSETRIKGEEFGVIGIIFNGGKTKNVKTHDRGESIQRNIRVRHNGQSISNNSAKHYVEENDSDVKAGRAGSSTILILEIKER
jgi:hypothetical protein